MAQRICIAFIHIRRTKTGRGVGGGELAFIVFNIIYSMGVKRCHSLNEDLLRPEISNQFHRYNFLRVYKVNKTKEQKINK